MVGAALYFEMCSCVLYCTENSKYSNCTVSSLKHLEDNQEICFHHHLKAHLIHYFNQDQMLLVMHMTQCRIWVSPGYFIK